MGNKSSSRESQQHPQQRQLRKKGDFCPHSRVPTDCRLCGLTPDDAFPSFSSNGPVFTCGHSCALSTKRCCWCLDQRPVEERYMHYVDGEGDVKTATRQQYYCHFCRREKTPPFGCVLPVSLPPPSSSPSCSPSPSCSSPFPEPSAPPLSSPNHHHQQQKKKHQQSHNSCSSPPPSNSPPTISPSAPPSPSSLSCPPSPLPSPPSSSPSSSSSNECVICLENPCQYAFVPCGHQCLCGVCSEKIGQGTPCPICRTPSMMVIRVFT